MKYVYGLLSLLLIPTLILAKAPTPEQLKQARNWKPVIKADGTPYINAEKAVGEIMGLEAEALATLHRREWKHVSAVVNALTEAVPAGGSFHLGSLRGDFDLRKLADGVQVTGGHKQSRITLGGGQKDLELVFTSGLTIQEGLGEDGQKPFRDSRFLLSISGQRILHPVEGCDWIAAVDAWGPHSAYANAPINDTLFLWFSTNWNFSDYNAHWGEPEKKNWAYDNAQVVWDLKGGGQGTRLYFMVETNYGNPGAGLWLENAKGLALYHGSTERPSADAPGQYVLKNCENVQLGLRRFFTALRGGHEPGSPDHALNIIGGRGNIIHILSSMDNSLEESFVNSDPELQVWSANTDFDVKGFDAPGILTFAFTPNMNVPIREENIALAKKIAEEQAPVWLKGRNRKSGLPDTPENLEILRERIRSGRDWWWPGNATEQVTFQYQGVNVTENAEAIKARLPSPPSIPATDAPKTFRPLYYTQEKGFGRALLEAGADPTGKTYSDDAFAQLMYGMPAEEVRALFARALQGDHSVIDRLHPIRPGQEGKRRPQRVIRESLDIPPGTFKLQYPLLLGFGNRFIMGAGPGITILRMDNGDRPIIKQQDRASIANLSLVGGRTGIEVTGADHNDKTVPWVAKSYVAGEYYYNIEFRDQTFTGFHVGRDEIDMEGGAEFDQNKFINLTFINTGDYGIYMNNEMLDKWLCLNNHFEGQKKAGISIKWNHLIHGGVYGSTFKNIDGPAIDFFGGWVNVSPKVAETGVITGSDTYQPYVVMVEECEFIECGNPDSAIVDLGYGEMVSITRCIFSTRNKQVATALRGAAQHYEDLDINVNLVEGAPAVMLRGVRTPGLAKPNGHIVRDVRANGPVVFVNDIDRENERYFKLWNERSHAREGKDISEVSWEDNAGLNDLAPPDGWLHPFVFYNATFGDRHFDYTLVNADPDTGRILKSVDLRP